MNLTAKSVLEPMHFEAAELSSGRRLVKQSSCLPIDENASDLTRSRLPVRGIITNSTTSRRFKAPEGNARPFYDYTSQRQEPERVAKPSVVWMPVIPQAREAFDVLQKFEGTVQSVTDDSFIARLVDKTNSVTEEEAEIPLAEIMPGDFEMVKPGAVFYWVIGYRREAHGQLSRSSMIRFQRLPSWSSAEVERAKQAAETFLSFLDLERANHPA